MHVGTTPNWCVLQILAIRRGSTTKDFHRRIRSFYRYLRGFNLTFVSIVLLTIVCINTYIDAVT